MKLHLVTLTRSKKGQVARAEQGLDAAQLKLGRGSDCHIHLPDPRVALHHAAFVQGDDGASYVEAVDGAVAIDGSFERRARLRVGQRLVMGPYEVHVVEPVGEVDLSLTLELIDTLDNQKDLAAQKLKTGLRNTWLNKRLFAWAGFVAVTALFLLWPTLNAMLGDDTRSARAKSPITADASWDVGPLSSAHATFGRDCVKCHQQPFVQVKNEACEDCHKSIGWHFPLTNPKANEVHNAVFSPPGDYRCASCHKDHKGVNGLVRTDASLCTDCHQDVKTRHPEISIPNISDFAKDHPTFKLAMLVPGKTGAEAVSRVPQDSKLRENSGLKFAHDVHVSPNGIRGPNGREKMECKNCHTPDESGLRFKPVTMKDHCQRCHSLEFEPQVTDRQVPHGSVDNAVFAVQSFYAQSVITKMPIDVVVDSAGRRPASTVSEPERRAAQKWASEKAAKVTEELFESRTCYVCHDVKRVPAANGKPATWSIPPIAVTQHFLVKSRFPHIHHNTFNCAGCHDVEKSKTSADLAIPDLKNCQGCHGGNEPTRDKARGTCETCHGFHTGSHRAGVPVITPAAEALKASGAGSAKTGTVKSLNPTPAKDSEAETTRDRPPAPRSAADQKGSRT
jgi:predicted CXXCH cytochrome family protein